VSRSEGGRRSRSEGHEGAGDSGNGFGGGGSVDGRDVLEDSLDGLAHRIKYAESVETPLLPSGVMPFICPPLLFFHSKHARRLLRHASCAASFFSPLLI
jgi:hypothetical protein